MGSKNGRRSTKGNKITPVCILKILKEKTDEEHVLQNADIRNILEEDYGIVVDRKKISDDIQLLREICNIDIVHNEGGPNAKGYWLRDRDFEDYELRMLIDSVLSNKYLSEKDSYELIQKLGELYGGTFNPHLESIIVLDRKRKTVSRDLYTKIEKINEAIETSTGMTMLVFEHQQSWKSPSYRKILPPACMLLKDNRYYMVLNHAIEEDEEDCFDFVPEEEQEKDCFEFIPIDNIRKIELSAKPGPRKTLGKKQKEALRHMIETHLTEDIETHPYYFYASGHMLTEIDDYFGVDTNAVRCKLCRDLTLKDLRIQSPPHITMGHNNQPPVIYEVKVTTTEELFMQFARKNMNYIKIIKPADIIERMTVELKHAISLYQST